MKVEIPFLERFREPMLNGTKVMTSRYKKMGTKGDTFEAFGATFQINRSYQAGLRYVSDHWQEEGCTSKIDFLNVWRQIHRRRGFRPDDWVWVHVFHKREEAGA